VVELEKNVFRVVVKEVLLIKEIKAIKKKQVLCIGMTEKMLRTPQESARTPHTRLRYKSVKSFERLSLENSAAGVSCSHRMAKGSVFLGSAA
jgi:hypothetical protein